MPPSIWDVFRFLFQGGEKTDDSDTGEDEDRFVPSPLDVSVRVGHGGAETERVRALSDIQDHAREIEDEQRGR